MSHILEYSGSALGIVGAALLASNTKVSKFGWLAYLLSNGALIALFVGMGSWGLLAQQYCFTATSFLGLVRSGLLDRPLASLRRRLARPRDEEWADGHG